MAYPSHKCTGKSQQAHHLPEAVLTLKLTVLENGALIQSSSTALYKVKTKKDTYHHQVKGDVRRKS